MVPIRAGRFRLLSARSIPGGVTPEPIRLVSACPAKGCADERVGFSVTFGPDGLFSRDRGGRPEQAGCTPAWTAAVRRLRCRDGPWLDTKGSEPVPLLRLRQSPQARGGNMPNEV